MHNILFSALIVGVVGWSAPLTAVAVAQGKTAEQIRFKTPQEALDALLEATKTEDLTRLRAIFGIEVGELCSGDEVQDRADFKRFATSLAAAAKFERKADDELMLVVGANAYAFPVPLVRRDGTWYFDTPAGKEEILNRRIGGNELRTIAVRRGYVAAQREYHAVDWDDDGVIEYAQQLASTPDKKDGLYWEAKAGEPASPLGPLVAQAQTEGHSRATTQPTPQSASGPRPYHGYYFKILKQQGEHAPGGKCNYVINGHMVAGFALVAWPVEWGDSGVMTFVVNSNGRVYQKDLGEKTAELAKAMTDYDPDKGWTVVKD